MFFLVGDGLVEVKIVGNLQCIDFPDDAFGQRRERMKLFVRELGDVIEMSARHDPCFIVINGRVGGEGDHMRVGKDAARPLFFSLYKLVIVAFAVRDAVFLPFGEFVNDVGRQKSRGEDL